LDDDAGALAALERAGWYPDAQLNLGRLHLKATRHGEAEAAFGRALKSFRPHEAWTRLGEFAASRGHLRRALGAFRRAAEVDRRGEYSLPLHQAITTLGNALLQQGRYFLHAHEDSLLSQAREGAKEPAMPRALERLAADAVAVRAMVREELWDACEAIERCAASRSLLPAYADRSPAQRLERAGRADATALATAWRDTQLALYVELLDSEEPDPRVVGDVTRVRRAMAARDWDAAFAALGSVDRSVDGGVELAAELAEALADRLRLFGDDARVAQALRLAEDGWAEFASWATAGGEGLARMVAVNRVRQKQRLG
jgi:tetratricopeptide (TPR) repeat protein